MIISGVQSRPGKRDCVQTYAGHQHFPKKHI